MSIRARGLLGFVALVLSHPHTWAGVYSPDEPTPFTVRADGTVTELAYGTEGNGPFPVTLVARQDELDANPARPNNQSRQAVLKRIAERRAKPAASRSPAEAAALAADYIRIGKPDDAVNLLTPLSRGRSPDFRVLANLVHAHATRGDWNEALNYFDLVRDFDELPADLAGTTADQRKWLRKVERQYYSKWLQVHRQRAAAKSPPEAEDVFPLFPVKFVNEEGRYEPGKLAAAEKAKLPPDAIPVVQQLILWAPWDIGLQWLLAELYAADGRVREAQSLFNRWGSSGAYSNRPTFMAHRTAVRDAVAKLPAEKATDDLTATVEPTAPPRKPEEPGKFLPSRSAVILGSAAFAVIAVLLLGLQVWVILRRRARRSS